MPKNSEKIKKHAESKTFIDAIEVFDSALMLREVKHKRYIVRHRPWHEEDISMCYKLIGNEEKYGVFDLISTCFNYGYMRGVQDERKKKNKRI